MNAIALAIAVATILFLIYALVLQYARSEDSETLPEEATPGREDDLPLVSADLMLQQIQQAEATPQQNENVTSSRTNTANQFHCPACGAIITASDERCPSCEISFVADGTQKWTLGKVGSADGIQRPLTEFRE